MSASHNPGGPEYDWGVKVIPYLSSYLFCVLLKCKMIIL